ncbi:MAG: hypothetical protein FJ316_07340 [SAR202 cluster bacterium]|nr:hypothetical protein [SAR202 cluster bacterium]
MPVFKFFRGKWLLASLVAAGSLAAAACAGAAGPTGPAGPAGATGGRWPAGYIVIGDGFFRNRLEAD